MMHPLLKTVGPARRSGPWPLAYRNEYPRLHVTDATKSLSAEMSRYAPQRRLRKSKFDGMVAGVLSGVAKYFGFSLTWLRIAFVVLALCTFGTALIAYLIMAVIMPED